MIVLTLVLLVYSGILDLRQAESSLISQSVVQDCQEVGDPLEPQASNGQPCSKKFVISMTLRSGQRETDALYANINSAFDMGKKQSSILKRPFRIEVEKHEVVANYRAYFVGTANANPTEEVIIFSSEECKDDWYGDDATCGKYKDINGTEQWDSQGFCCRCERIKGYLVRANNAKCFGHFFEMDRATVVGQDEKTTHKFKSSAHCMTMSELWYDVFDIESPSLHYKIRISIHELQEVQLDRKKNPVYSWRRISNFTLSPDQTIGKSTDGRVIAELQGDLLGGRGMMDLSTKNLLVPSLRTWHESHIPEEYENGPPDWLVVDRSLVDLSGRECNKVGLSFSGFRNQPGRCHTEPDSCFSNQPSTLWTADNERRKQGLPGFYMMHNYGKIHPSTHPNNSSFIMRLMYPNLHNSFITFRIDATDLRFVVNAGKGRIVSAESRGFTKSTKTAGEVVVRVENLAEVSQDFNVVLTKCFGRDQLPSKRVSLYPGETETVIFALLGRNKGKITTECEVQLFDQRFSLLGTARLTFSVEAPCFCFGVCDCVCDETTGKVTEKQCPTPPPITIDARSTGTKLALWLLDFIGLHSIVALFGSLLLCMGCLKLVCGGVICCRKSKAQQHYDDQREKGVPLKSPNLVKCSGYCQGALAAKAKIKRRAERMRKTGKEPHRYDDWTNMSYTCYCNAELADIRCMAIIKALCFFYYLLILPFIWLGKKIWWCCFADTLSKRQAAEKAVIKAAEKKGPKELEKLGVVNLRDELKKYKSLDQKKQQKIKEALEQRRLQEAKIQQARVQKARAQQARVQMARIQQDRLEQARLGQGEGASSIQRDSLNPSQRPSMNSSQRPSMNSIQRPSMNSSQRPSMNSIQRPSTNSIQRPSVNSSLRSSLQADNASSHGRIPQELQPRQNSSSFRESLSLNAEVERQSEPTLSPPQEGTVDLDFYEEEDFGIGNEGAEKLSRLGKHSLASGSSSEASSSEASKKKKKHKEKKKKKKKKSKDKEKKSKSKSKHKT